MSTSHTYKLTYFNVKGAAETVRMMFAAADVKYEDERISRDDWPKHKPNTPQGVLPLLCIDGKYTVVQSAAIARFVARQFKFYGKNDIDACHIDQITETVNDLIDAVRPAFRESDEKKKAEMMKKFETEDGPRILGYIEKLIEKFGKDGYAACDCLSVADTTIQSVIEFLQIKDKLEKFPKICACVKKVESHPKIAKWIKERPVTER